MQAKFEGGSSSSSWLATVVTQNDILNNTHCYSKEIV